MRYEDHESVNSRPRHVFTPHLQSFNPGSHRRFLNIHELSQRLAETWHSAGEPLMRCPGSLGNQAPFPLRLKALLRRPAFCCRRWRMAIGSPSPRPRSSRTRQTTTRTRNVFHIAMKQRAECHRGLHNVPVGLRAESMARLRVLDQCYVNALARKLVRCRRAAPDALATSSHSDGDVRLLCCGARSNGRSELPGSCSSGGGARLLVRCATLTVDVTDASSSPNRG